MPLFSVLQPLIPILHYLLSRWSSSTFPLINYWNSGHMDNNSGSYGRGWRTPVRGIFLRLDFFLSTRAMRTCKWTARPRGFGEGQGSHCVTELGWSRPSGSSHCLWEPNLVCFPLWRTSPSSLYCLRLIGGPQTRRIINVESNYRLRWEKKETRKAARRCRAEAIDQAAGEDQAQPGFKRPKHPEFCLLYVFHSTLRVFTCVVAQQELPLQCHSARVCVGEELLTACPAGTVNPSVKRRRDIDRCRQLVAKISFALSRHRWV